MKVGVCGEIGAIGGIRRNRRNWRNWRNSAKLIKSAKLVGVTKSAKFGEIWRKLPKSPKVAVSGKLMKFGRTDDSAETDDIGGLREISRN